jgi:lysozyme
MNYEQLKKSLILHEGVVNKVYLDTLGYKTAGIGHLLKGIEANLPVGHAINNQQIHAWFETDVEEALGVARQAINLDSLSPERQLVVVNMAFNLGHKLFQFKNTLQAIKDGRYEDAANGMLQSKWASQVGNRAVQLAHTMKTSQINWL